MDKQANLLFIINNLGMGGSQKIQTFVANACAKRGYKVNIISMSNKESTLNINPDISVSQVSYDHVLLSKDNPIKYFIYRLHYLLKLRKECKNINPDLICVFRVDIIRIVVFALLGLKYPILASERGDPSRFGSKKNKQYSKALNRCSAIVYQLEEQSEYYNINPNVIKRVIPNPVIRRNSYEPISNNRTNESFIFGAGRLVEQKRFDVLIDAYDIVRMTHPEYRLKIYGDGHEMENLKRQVEILKIENYVDFVGNVNNIFQDVNENSIFVLSSDYEGIPNVIAEVLINSVPCISTDSSPGGARLLLDNGKNGDIVARGDYEQLASKIKYYIENPNYVKEKIGNGTEYIKKFDPPLIEKKWLDLIDELVTTYKPN